MTAFFPQGELSGIGTRIQQTKPVSTPPDGNDVPRCDEKQIPCGNDSKKNKGKNKSKNSCESKDKSNNKSRFPAGMTARKARTSAGSWFPTHRTVKLCDEWATRGWLTPTEMKRAPEFLLLRS